MGLVVCVSITFIIIYIDRIAPLLPDKPSPLLSQTCWIIESFKKNILLDFLFRSKIGISVFHSIFYGKSTINGENWYNCTSLRLNLIKFYAQKIHKIKSHVY